MGDYGNQGRGGRGGNRFGGNRGGNNRFGGGRGRNSDGGGQREMFVTVCDDCGNECEVPFRPSGDKPVYCSNCFEARGNEHSDDSFSRRPAQRFNNRREERSSAPRQDNSQLLEAINLLNLKLDKVMKVIESKLNNDVVIPKVIVQKPKAKKAVKVDKSEKSAKKSKAKKAKSDV